MFGDAKDANGVLRIGTIKWRRRRPSANTKYQVISQFHCWNKACVSECILTQSNVKLRQYHHNLFVLFSIILGLAESDVLTLDPDVQKAALHIINNLVCGPHSRGIGRIVPGMSKKKSTGKGGEDLLSKMWGLVRANNGIMVSERIVQGKKRRIVLCELRSDFQPAHILCSKTFCRYG